jgi:menaquinone-dependent protoporphyrinogen oxidase
MKTLIAYSTTHGCTEKTAQKLKEHLGKEVDLVNLKKNPKPIVGNYDRIIIGGSIHAGRIQKRITEFCRENLTILQEKELGLYICCMEEGEKASIQFADAYPEVLRRKAKVTACFGGEFDFDKMSLFQRLIVKKVAKIEHSTSKVDYEAIQNFSKKMDRVFNPFLFLV